MSLNRFLRKTLVSMLVGVALSPITPISSAQATTPACTPSYVGAATGYFTRNYIFNSVGTCNWTVPVSVYVRQIALIGGGGGGGGGSWQGSTGGGGGGGGGGGMRVSNAINFLTAGQVISVTVGDGGSAGAGASVSGSSGTDGGTGGVTKFGTLEVDGGSGGGGGGNDIGGAGGSSGTRLQVGGNASGGSQSSGNGGGGAVSINGGDGVSANSSSAGNPRPGTTLNAAAYIYPSGTTFLSGGGGGATDGHSSLTGGTISNAPASTVSNTGSGGSGGHGCPASYGTCTNRNGSAGASGKIFVVLENAMSRTDDSWAFFGKVGDPISYKPFNTPDPMGNPRWRALQLPPGLSIDTATGVVSGTPTTPFYLQSHISYSDTFESQLELGAVFSFRISKGEAKPPQVEFSDISLEYGKSYRIPVEVFRGTAGTSGLSLTTNLCSTSGPKNETVTALASSGTCQIVVENVGDTNYNGWRSTFNVKLLKQVPSVGLSKSASGAVEVGTPITLTATIPSAVTGSIEFYAGDTLIRSCGSGSGYAAISNGLATCTWTPTSASGSPYALKAKYLGSTNYGIATSSSITQVVYPSISLSYPGSTSVFGNSATVTPNVSGGTGSPSTWTWAIKKTSDNSTVSGISINSSGVVSVSSSLAAATYNMTVTATDSVSITKSASVSIYVAPSTPVVQLNRPTRTTVTKGQSISLSATLPSDATGTVVFKFGSTSITSCGTSGNVTVSSGTATCTWNTSTVTANTYDVTAQYSGGGSYTSTTSNPLSVVINNQAQFTYSSGITNYGVATTISPLITANTGTGDSSAWTWAIVKTSDSSTVSGISIDSTGLVSVSNSIGAGSYGMSVSAVDLAGDTVTATAQITVNKVRPTLTLSPRMTSGGLLSEATANRSFYWRVESSHPSSTNIGLVVNGSTFNCMNPSIAYSPAQCWVNNATANSTQTVYATFAGDSNLETATSNTVTGFKINGDLTLSYSDTSTYGGFATSISPIVAGGSGVKTFGISQHTTGYQVDGITIDTATGVISVLRSTTVGNYRMVASVTDEVSAYSYYNDLYINVLSQQSPTFSLSRTSETVDKDAEVTGFSISHSSTPAILYSISPSLPNGLRFSTHSGVISGAPTVAQSATAYTITAINNAGSETATFTLAVSEQLVATISVSIGTNPAAKGTANTIIATISAAGKVQFFIDGKRVPGCLAVRGTTSATCNWKPSRIGAAIIKATLKPTNGSIPTISSTPLQVSVGRRTGARG